jgi:hypothetical protein
MAGTQSFIDTLRALCVFLATAQKLIHVGRNEFVNKANADEMRCANLMT